MESSKSEKAIVERVITNRVRNPFKTVANLFKTVANINKTVANIFKTVANLFELLSKDGTTIPK